MNFIPLKNCLSHDLGRAWIHIERQSMLHSSFSSVLLASVYFIPRFVWILFIIKNVLLQEMPKSSVVEMVWVHGAVSVSKRGGKSLPFAPLAPVLGREVKAFGVYAQMSLLHGFFMSVHDLL